MARPETKWQTKFRDSLPFVSDRVEITAGSTPGFPDCVFWVHGLALPVECKVGFTSRGRLFADFKPTQKLWWRKAHIEGRRAMAAASWGDRVVLLPPSRVPELWESGVKGPHTLFPVMGDVSTAAALQGMVVHR